MSEPVLFQIHTGSSSLASTVVYLKDLTENSVQYIPLPPDDMFDLSYPTTHNTRCSLCNSPWRERAEHVYIQNKQKPQSVIKFFEDHFHAKVTHEAVSTHMKYHCTFRGLSLGGIEDYLSRESSISKIKFREIRAIDCSKNPELKFKQAAMANQITDRIANVKQRRDEAAKNSIDIFSILLEIYNELSCVSCKKILQLKVGEIRRKLIEEAG